TVLIEKAPSGYPICLAALVLSALGMHIVLTRSMYHAGLEPERPAPKLNTVGLRARYSAREFKVAWSRIPWVVAEFSGSLLYLLLIFLALLGVLLANASAI